MVIFGTPKVRFWGLDPKKPLFWGWGCPEVTVSDHFLDHFFWGVDGNHRIQALNDWSMRSVGAQKVVKSDLFWVVFGPLFGGLLPVLTEIV